MNIPNDFCSFLQELGIFNAHQADEYVQRGGLEDEDRSIFKLADFFKGLTPSDCYDLALRLYLYWNNTLHENKARKLDSRSPAFTSLQGTLTNGQISTRDEPNLKKKRKSQSHSLGGDGDEHYDSMNRSSQRSGDIFERLHAESYVKDHIKRLNEESRVMDEIKECTFKPNVTKSENSKVDVTSVIERLHKDHRKAKEEINAEIRAMKEVEGCTFHPEVHSSVRHDVSNFDYPLNLSVDHTFDRLYREGNLKRHIKMENEIKKQEQELKDCTFKPISTNRKREELSPADVNEKIKKLYNTHFEQQRSLIRKRLEQNVKEVEDCTFKPKILSPAARTNENAPDRLLKWDQERKKKVEEKLREQEEMELIAARRGKGRDVSADKNYIDKLYKDGEKKKSKMEELERKVLREIGASFTPKVNQRKATSPSSSSVVNLKAYATVSNHSPAVNKFGNRRKSLKDLSDRSIDRSMDKKPKGFAGKTSDKKENLKTPSVASKKPSSALNRSQADETRVSMFTPGEKTMTFGAANNKKFADLNKKQFNQYQFEDEPEIDEKKNNLSSFEAEGPYSIENEFKKGRK